MNLFLLPAHVPASTIFLFMSGDLLRCFNLWFVKYILLGTGEATPRRVQLVTVQARQRSWQQNKTLLGKHLCCAFKSSVGGEARTVWEVEAVAPGLYLRQGQNKKIKTLLIVPIHLLSFIIFPILARLGGTDSFWGLPEMYSGSGAHWSL